MGQRKRAVTANGVKIKELRTALTWTTETLAHRSGLNVKTVRTAESGKGIDISSIKCLADALGVEASELLPQTAPPTGIKPTKKINISVILPEGGPYGPDTSKKLLEAVFESLISAQDQIIVVEITKGSVIVELEISEEDLIRLITAFREARLDSIQVQAVSLPPTSGPLAAALLQIIDPDDPAATLPDPVTSKMTLFRTPDKSLPFSVEKAESNQTRISTKERWSLLALLASLTIPNLFIFGLIMFIWSRDKPKPGVDFPHLLIAGLSLNIILFSIFAVMRFWQSRKKN